MDVVDQVPESKLVSKYATERTPHSPCYLPPSIVEPLVPRQLQSETDFCRERLIVTMCATMRSGATPLAE